MISYQERNCEIMEFPNTAGCRGVSDSVSSISTINAVSEMVAVDPPDIRREIRNSPTQARDDCNCSTAFKTIMRDSWRARGHNLSHAQANYCEAFPDESLDKLQGGRVFASFIAVHGERETSSRNRQLFL